MIKKMNARDLAGGVILEKLDVALVKIADNINDKNTSLVQREVTLKVKFKIDAKRDLANITIEDKLKLAPDEPFATRAYIGKDIEGNGEFYEDNPKQPNLPLFNGNQEADENNVTPIKGAM